MVTFGRGLAAALVISAGFGTVELARADTITFIGGGDGTDNSWGEASNWDPSPPGAADDVVIAPSLNGVVILDGDDVTVNSLQLDAGINVNAGGKLTVTDTIVNNGIGGTYTINAGVIVAGSGGIINTYTDDATFGYIGNEFSITAQLDNNGVVINGGDGIDPTLVLWTGDVTNGSTGFVSNSGGKWVGNVTANAAGIYNTNVSEWVGDVVANSSEVQNEAGSSWTGDVLSNDGNISNVEGATWHGDVVSNSSSVNNDGGIWNGNVLANAGTLYSTSIWNGDLTSSGDLWLSGEVNGRITNNGGGVHVLAPLSGVTDFVNNGGMLDMVDDDASDSFRAESWSGTGAAIFDFAPGEARTDHVILSSDYSGDTTVDLNFTGPAGRALGDFALLTVGRTNTGTLTVNNLPAEGIISYRLVEAADGWRITSDLSDAPQHVASAIALVGRSTARLTAAPDAADCNAEGWVRPVGGGEGGTISGADWQIGAAGIAGGRSFDCIAMPGTDAELRLAISGGLLAGAVSEDFGGGNVVDGSFAQGFATLQGDLDAGALHAALAARVGVTTLQLRDPQSGLDTANLASLGLDVTGSAGYDLDAGALTFTPELGFALSSATSGSSGFGDVGGMSLVSGPSLDVYAGLTAAARIETADLILSPFASIALHGEILSPSATFAPDEGGSATVELPEQGHYIALDAGLDLLQRDQSEAFAGLRADIDYGPQVTRLSLGGYAQVAF